MLSIVTLCLMYSPEILTTVLAVALPFVLTFNPDVMQKFNLERY